MKRFTSSNFLFDELTHKISFVFKMYELAEKGSGSIPIGMPMVCNTVRLPF